MIYLTRPRPAAAFLSVVTAALCLAGCGSRPAAPTDPNELEAAVAFSIPRGGPQQTQEATVAEGKVIFVRVRSAIPTLVQVEGQSAKAHVAPKHPATLVFAANTAGTYDVLASGQAVPVARITVVGP